MKKFLLIITLLCTGINYAQQEGNIFIEEGRWALGGGLSLSNTLRENESINSDNRVKSFNISVMPRIGYSIADNWLLGLNLDYNYGRQEVSSSSSSSSSSNNGRVNHSLGFAPTIQKYFPVDDKFAFNLQGSLRYVRRWSESLSSSTTDSFVENGYSVAIRPGFSYFMGDHFALEATTGILSYSMIKDGDNHITVNEAHNFSLDFGLSSIHFGAIYYF